VKGRARCGDGLDTKIFCDTDRRIIKRAYGPGTKGITIFGISHALKDNESTPVCESYTLVCTDFPSETMSVVFLPDSS
jgi:hypothetical protein